jgi:hypothetical protein
MSELNEAAPPEPGATPAVGSAKLPVTVALSQLPQFERSAPDGKPITMWAFRWPEQLLRGDVIEGLRDPWAVVAQVTRSGPDVTIRVQEAGGSRTTEYGAQERGFGVRRDIRVESSTIPDIPDGFPPRWGVWRQGIVSSRTLAWYPEPGKAAEHARQASRDGREYVVELEAPDGSWAQVDAYQEGRRSTWGKHLAAGLSKTVIPPWATPGNHGTADRTAGQPASLAGSGKAKQGKAPAHRASAPGAAGSSPAQQAGEGFPRAPLTGPAVGGERLAARPVGPGPAMKPPKP